jgi:hypothetical protein
MPLLLGNILACICISNSPLSNVILLYLCLHTVQVNTIFYNVVLAHPLQSPTLLLRRGARDGRVINELVDTKPGFGYFEAYKTGEQPSQYVTGRRL